MFKPIILSAILISTMSAKETNLVTNFSKDYMDACTKSSILQKETKNINNICYCSLNAILSIYNNQSFVKLSKGEYSQDVVWGFSAFIHSSVENCLIVNERLR